jgi:hypothetical protein
VVFALLDAPVCYFPSDLYLIKKTKYIYLIGILLAWFIFYSEVDWALISVTFFSVGAFIAIHGIQLPGFNKNYLLLISVILGWIFLSYIACIVYDDNFVIKCLIRNVAILCGLVAVWLLYDIR